MFLINLDRSPDRLEATAAELSASGLEWRRVAAVDGNDIELPNSSLVDERAYRRRHHAVLRRGEVGCYLSHYKALGMFLETGAPHALILEDDVTIPRPGDLLDVVSALEECAAEWDLVKLHATHPGGVIGRRSLRDPYRLVSLAFRHGSAAAYMLNRRAASLIREGMLPMTVPYDHEFDRPIKYDLRLRCVLPLPISRRVAPSTISASSQVDPTERTVNARLHRPWYNQAGMLFFRGSNDVARVLRELINLPVRYRSS